MINTLLSRSFAGAVIHFGLLPLGASPDPGRKVCHEQDDREEAFDKTLRIRKVMKRMRLSVSMKKGRKSITLVICPAALVVSCPQGSGD